MPLYIKMRRHSHSYIYVDFLKKLHICRKNTRPGTTIRAWYRSTKGHWSDNYKSL